MGEMEGMELACFQIISYAGEAKSNYIQAMRCSREGDFEKAEELIKAGKESYLKAHEAHSKLLAEDSSGENLGGGLLVVHAEDQLNSADIFQVIAQEHLELVRMVRKDHE